MMACAHSKATLLLYHAIGDAAPVNGGRFAVSAPAFLDQLRMLEDMRRRGAIQVVDLAAWWSGGVPTAPRPVVVCFDDGGRSDFEAAWPRLREFGLPATFFICTALVGQPGYMNWEQIRELARAGMHIGCHGHDHVPLCRLAQPQLEQHLRTARQRLREATGTPVEFLAAPYGLWNRRVLAATRSAGFRALATSRPGRAAAGAQALPRNGIRCSTGLRDLQHWLAGGRASFAGRLGRHGILWLPKQILLRTRPDWPALPVAPASKSTF